MNSLHIHEYPELYQDVHDLVWQWVPGTLPVKEMDALADQITKQLMNSRILADRQEWTEPVKKPSAVDKSWMVKSRLNNCAIEGLKKVTERQHPEDGNDQTQDTSLVQD